MRGGTPCISIATMVSSGLSPRARRNHSRAMDRLDLRRSIAACAAEPRRHINKISVAAVYRRVRGGTLIRTEGQGGSQGLSPRARRNRSKYAVLLFQHRSIAACAAEPNGLYGAMCNVAGLSPRARRNQRIFFCGHGTGGSIAACAAEPVKSRFQRSFIGVYRRVRGGTQRRSLGWVHGLGLSPRARRNHWSRSHPEASGRSIAACAAEPDHSPRCCYRPWVYRRVRGGTGDGPAVP